MKHTNESDGLWPSLKRAGARFVDAFPMPRHEPMLWLLILPLLVWKCMFCYHTGTSGFLDGSYYFDIAQNVRDGIGFYTDVSLYHQGMASFPHPSPVYPLWPALLGFLGKFIPLKYLVHWLPAFLFLCTLLLAYVFVSRVCYVKLFELEEGWEFHSGHVMVMILALHEPFFMFTCQPYTEALTYTLLFLALFRARHFFAAPNVWRGLEMGGWMAILLLVRSQMLLFVIAFVMVFPLFLFRFAWRKMLLVGAACVAGVFLVLTPHHLFLAQFMDPAPWLLLRFDKYNATSGLSAVQIMVQTKGLWALIKDRAYGFYVAFYPRGGSSYVRVFQYVQYGLLVAAPLWFWVGLKAFRRHSYKDLFDWIKRDQRIFHIFLVLMSLGGFFSIHLMHKRLFAPWNFTTRHGITCGFLFFIAIVFLSRYHWSTKLFVLFLIPVSMADGYNKLRIVTQKEMKNRRGAPDYSKIAGWINRNTKPGKRTIFAKVAPQTIAPYTPNASYHWIYEETTHKDLIRMFDTLGAKYLLMDWGTKKYAFFKRQRKAFDKLFCLDLEKAYGYDIYVRRRGTKPCPPPKRIIVKKKKRGTKASPTKRTASRPKPKER